MNEEWKVWKRTEVVPFGNKLAPPYTIIWEVSNMGRAKRNGVIQIGVNDRGYVYIGGRSLHRIVAKLFIPNPENKKCVDHINGIRHDNRVENLRWCTHKENSNFPLAKKHLRKNLKPKRGTDHPCFGKKWTLEQKALASIRQRKTHSKIEVRTKLSNSRKGSFRVYDENGKYHFEH